MVNINVNFDGLVIVVFLNLDIGGLCVFMVFMVVEVLGIDFEKICIIIGDMVLIGYSGLIGGSCVIFVVGMVVVEVVKDVVK